MERRHGRTETLGSTTIVAVIRADDPVLRPGLPRDVRAVVSRFDGTRMTRESGTFEVTFRYGMHWDVARIHSRLELRYEHDTADGELVTR